MVDEGARDGEPLLFAARELVGIALHLVGEADQAKGVRDLLVREGTDVPSGDQDLTLRRADLADQRLDQGRLAAARRSDEEDELAAVYPQADVLEPDVAPGIDLGHPAQLDDRRAAPLLGEVLGAALRPGTRRAGQVWCLSPCHRSWAGRSRPRASPDESPRCVKERRERP